MKLIDSSVGKPYAVAALALAVAVMGLAAFFRTPTDLFPNTVPPQVAVVIVRPGSAAEDIADKVTRVVESEFKTLDGVQNVRSTTRDEVASVNVEFGYDKDPGEAVLDVQNAVARVRGRLPDDIREPIIHRISDATRPILTLAARPSPESGKSLAEVRLLAENDIKDALLSLPGVGDVEVFGGHEPEVKVLARRDDLAARGLSIGSLVEALRAQNVAGPAGTIYAENTEHLVTVNGEFDDPAEIGRLAVKRDGGGFVRVGDVAAVRAGEAEKRSAYHGNGSPAIALNVMRLENAPTVGTIETVKNYLPRLRERYPDIEFEITDDQQPLIDLNVHGMRSSLVQAVLITVLVIFFFLADMRAAAVVAVSIPLTFLGSLVVLRNSPFSMNMVTLSGLIIAVGMVVDASVVVLENIHRRRAESPDGDGRRAAVEGAGEIALEITAGMLTTVIVLIPVLFTGGYTQRIMRPLNLMLLSSLALSLLVALTVVPLIASRLMKREEAGRNSVERLAGRADRHVTALARFYTGLMKRALRHRAAVMAVLLVFLVVTARVVVPLNGGELMPPMDTGISSIEFKSPSGRPPEKVEETLAAVEKVVYETDGIETVSSVMGSEAGAISFGAGAATPQAARLTIHMVDRTKRDRTIWQIQNGWREKLRRIPGIGSFQVNEYGATPVSTTKAPLDVIVSGPDPHVLDGLAGRVMKILGEMRGLVDLRRSRQMDKTDYEIKVDPDLAAFYGTSPAQVSKELKIMVRGVTATSFSLAGMLDIPVTVQYAENEVERRPDLAEAYVSTRLGLYPLRALAAIGEKQGPPFITRENLNETIDVTGINRVRTIARVTGEARRRLAAVKTPAGYGIDVGGSASNLAEARSRMGRALLVGIVLLYFLLVAIFNSFRLPVTVMSVIPPALAGAMWGLFIFHKPMCMPAMMGMVLLGGTIVNNSILLLGFVEKARERGMPREEALAESVRLRVRPILMTTVSTILGLSPLIFETAVGLERMSPLGIAAAAGLTLGTLVTMVIVPVVYTITEDLAAKVSAPIRKLAGQR